MEPNDFWLWIAAFVFLCVLISLAWGVVGWITG